MILSSSAHCIQGGAQIDVEIVVPRLFCPKTISFPDFCRGMFWISEFRLGNRESLVCGDCEVTSFERLFSQMSHPTLESYSQIFARVKNASASANMFAFDILGVCR